MERGVDQQRGVERRATERVAEVASLNVPEAVGGWPCALCEQLFPVADSWAVTLARSGTVISCEPCARDAHRRRSHASPVSTHRRTA